MRSSAAAARVGDMEMALVTVDKTQTTDVAASCTIASDQPPLQQLQPEKQEIQQGLDCHDESGWSLQDSGAGSNNINNSKKLTTPTGWIVFLILLVGGCASAVIIGFGVPSSQGEQEREFNRIADDLFQQFDTALHDYIVAGLWTHDACHDNTESHEEFRLLYRHLMETGLELQAVSWAINITDAERPAHENFTKAFVQEKYPDINYQGITGFELNTTTGVVGVGPRSRLPFYYIIHFLEPLEDIKNQKALDFDIYSSPSRRAAIDQAIATGYPALTDRLKLIQESEAGTDAYAYSVILMHPGLPDIPPKDMAVIAIRFPELLARAHQKFAAKEGVSVYVFDSTGSPESPPFLGGVHLHSDHGNLSYAPETELANVQPKGSVYMRKDDFEIASKTWTFVVVSAPDSFSPDLLYVIMGAVALFVASCCIALWVFTNTRRVQKLNEIRAAAESEKAAFMITTAKQSAKTERELNDFIAHEVRNPLAAAISACSFVSGSVNEDQPLATEASRETVREDVGIINNSLQFINDLLRNLLDMHRAASKQLTVEKAHVDLLRDVLEPVASMIYQRGEQFTVITDCPENLVVMGDRLRLRQVILNLGRNSVKFVSTGYVKLGATIVDGNVIMYVEDSGPGIPVQKRQHLFAKFQESLDSLNQGTGIGLSLSFNLAGLMGGSLDLDDTYDSGIPDNPGARFVLDLQTPPLAWGEKEEDGMMDLARESSTSLTDPAQVADDTDESELKILPEGLNVLFVDDSFVLRKLFCRTVKRATIGWKFSEAANGETGILMVESDTYDLVFVDQYMASVDKQLLGTEAVRAMRTKGISCTICGLSANDLEKQFLESGADAFLFKPFPSDDGELQKELMRIIDAGAKNGRAICTGLVSASSAAPA